MNMPSFTLLSRILFSSVFLLFASCKDWSKAELPQSAYFDYLEFSHRLLAPEMGENSGIVVDRRGIMWGHNDSNGQARLFAFDQKGEFQSELTLDGVENVDWEDIATVNHQGSEYLLISDTGNNWHGREESPLYLVKRPDSLEAKMKVKPQRTITVRFEGDAIDCESITYDEETDTLFLVEKNYTKLAYVYSISNFMTSPESKRIAKKITQLHIETATAMDSRENKIIILTPYAVYLYERKEYETWTQALSAKPLRYDVPEILPQTEGLCFSHDGRYLFFSSETDGYGIGQTPIYRIRLGR